MIVGLSSSSPLVSVALLEGPARVIVSASRLAPTEAGRTIIDLLDECLSSINATLEQATGFVADVGPGSFIGTRVAVVMAKAYGFQFKVSCAGVSAFDLIDSTGTAVIPSRKGEFFIRVPGSEPFRVAILPPGAFLGYGEGIDSQTFPLAAHLSQLSDLTWIAPEALVPNPLIEPSISKPKAASWSR